MYMQDIPLSSAPTETDLLDGVTLDDIADDSTIYNFMKMNITDLSAIILQDIDFADDTPDTCDDAHSNMQQRQSSSGQVVRTSPRMKRPNPRYRNCDIVEYSMRRIRSSETTPGNMNAEIPPRIKSALAPKQNKRRSRKRRLCYFRSSNTKTAVTGGINGGGDRIDGGDWCKQNGSTDITSKSTMDDEIERFIDFLKYDSSLDSSSSNSDEDGHEEETCSNQNCILEEHAYSKSPLISRIATNCTDLKTETRLIACKSSGVSLNNGTSCYYATVFGNIIYSTDVYANVLCIRTLPKSCSTNKCVLLKDVLQNISDCYTGVDGSMKTTITHVYINGGCAPITSCSSTEFNVRVMTALMHVQSQWMNKSGSKTLTNTVVSEMCYQELRRRNNARIGGRFGATMMMENTHSQLMAGPKPIVGTYWTDAIVRDSRTNRMLDIEAITFDSFLREVLSMWYLDDIAALNRVVNKHFKKIEKSGKLSTTQDRIARVRADAMDMPTIGATELSGILNALKMCGKHFTTVEFDSCMMPDDRITVDAVSRYCHISTEYLVVNRSIISHAARKMLVDSVRSDKTSVSLEDTYLSDTTEKFYMCT